MATTDIDADTFKYLAALLHNQHHLLPQQLAPQELLNLTLAIEFLGVEAALLPHLRLLVSRLNADEMQFSKTHIGVALHTRDRDLRVRIHEALRKHYTGQ
ncbi:hypothetical protein CKM354_000035100 [Cercospora kikuchii]|uniref:Uncharacterized protein n=1 Tax=Cercospora kikuchii TaxID=84275 RepID=A0A9P3FBT0_9PEZI|nr:uncharacterized protein CKM354_000035100 [Cercospora kikuchii]GIZ36885.1 hypothetical protein CKM354_000035100 [Cercospora kikuchii]